jgi:SAM-dependent methyltransferase
MKKLLRSILSKEARISLRRLYYFGFRFECPLCSSRLRTMFDSGLPFAVLRDTDVVGGEQMRCDICPVCFSNSRTRLIWEYIQREFNPASIPRVLHIAPEYALMSYLLKVSDYTGADIDPAAFRSHGNIVYCDVTDINFPDDTFDLIICSHVLEHVPRDDIAITELYRVLKSGGAAILQVPIGMKLHNTIEDPLVTDSRERELRFGQFDHVRIYGLDFPNRLAAGGFEVEIVDPTRRWGQEVVRSRRLNSRERIFVGRKGNQPDSRSGESVAAVSNAGR